MRWKLLTEKADLSKEQAKKFPFSLSYNANKYPTLIITLHCLAGENSKKYSGLGEEDHSSRRNNNMIRTTW
jgi:hypothetical protein